MGLGENLLANLRLVVEFVVDLIDHYLLATHYCHTPIQPCITLVLIVKL